MKDTPKAQSKGTPEGPSKDPVKRGSLSQSKNTQEVHLEKHTEGLVEGYTRGPVERGNLSAVKGYTRGPIERGNLRPVKERH